MARALTFDATTASTRCCKNAFLVLFDATTTWRISGHATRIAIQTLVHGQAIIPEETYRSHRVFRDLQLTQALETLLSVSGGAIVIAVNQTPNLGDRAAFELTGSGAGPLWLPFSC